MSLLLTSNWSFGIGELINCIAAFLTFVAIYVSLYLAQKSKTLKLKVIGKKIIEKAMLKHQYQQLDILNNGHIKFTCTAVGYYINKKYYYNARVNFIKKLDVTLIEQKSHGKNYVTTESLILPTYVREGDIIQLGLWPAEFKFDEEKPTKKVYIFLIINGKLKKYYTGYKYGEFYNLIKDFNKISGINKSTKTENIEDDYFR